MSKDLDAEDIFIYQLEKLRIIEDIVASYEDPAMQKKFKQWQENKKRLKTKSGETVSSQINLL